MKFRNFLYRQILNLVRHSRENLNYQNLKTEIFFFQIGSFPSSPFNLHHECPPFILECQKHNVNVNLICIDPNYKNFLENPKVRDRIHSYKFPTFIYSDLITQDDYICLVEFCHFISNFSCLSLINEMTGEIRKAFYQSIHQTPYLFIGPSQCTVEIDSRISCPLLKKEVLEKLNSYGHLDKKLTYYWETYRKIDKLYLELDFGNVPKIRHLEAIIRYQLSKVSSFYVRIINYHNLDEYQNLKDSTSLEKDTIEQNNLLDSLEKRFNDDIYDFINLKNEYYQSKFKSWDVFLRNKISFILIAALHFKYKKNTEYIKKNQKYINFETSQDINQNLLFLQI